MRQCFCIAVLKKIIVATIIHIGETSLYVCAVPQFQCLVPPITALIEAAHFCVNAPEPLIKNSHFSFWNRYRIAYIYSTTEKTYGFNQIATHDVCIAKVVGKNNLVIGIGYLFCYAECFGIAADNRIGGQGKLGIINGKNLIAHHLKTLTIDGGRSVIEITLNTIAESHNRITARGIAEQLGFLHQCHIIEILIIGMGQFIFYRSSDITYIHASERIVHQLAPFGHGTIVHRIATATRRQQYRQHKKFTAKKYVYLSHDSFGRFDFTHKYKVK